MGNQLRCFWSWLFQGNIPLYRLNSEYVLKIFFSGFFFLSLNPIFAQKSGYRLSGNVRDATTGAPIPDANVYLENSEKGTVTDDDGEYELLLPIGEFTIVISFSGYISQRIPMKMDRDRVLNLKLSEGNVELDEVIISGEVENKNVQGLVLGAKTIKTEDIVTLPTFLGQTDVVRTLLLLPGVSSVGEGAQGFNVRGGKVGQNLVLYDGAQLFNASHVLGLFSSFNTDAVESFDLYKGHIPARFGGRLSAVLDVKGKEGDYENHKVNASIGVLTTKAKFEGPIWNGKTSFLVGGRITYSDWVLGLVNNPEVKQSSVAFHDVNATVSHRFGLKNKFSLGYYRSRDRFQFANDFGYDYGTDIGNLHWSTTLNERLGLNFNGSYSGYGATSFDPEGFDAFDLDTGVDHLNGRAGAYYLPNKKYTLRLGGEWNDYRIRTEEFVQIDADGQPFSQLVDKERGREWSAYIENDIELLPWLSFSLGARYTLFQNIGPYEVFEYEPGNAIIEENTVGSSFFGGKESIQEYSGLEPRVSAKIQLTENSSFKLAYNRTRQYLHSVSNSASPTPADLWQLSNRYFEPQIADNYSAGYFRNFDHDNIEFSLEGFYRNIDNQVEFRDFAELFLNNRLETELASGTARAYGAEFLLNKKLGNWSGWLSYTYSRSLVTVNNEFLEETINEGNEFPSNFDQPHKLNIVVKRKLGKKSAFSASFTYITGRPITAIESSFQSGATVVPIFGERNGQRIPDFIRLDASFTIAENIFKGRVVRNPNKKFKDNLSISFYNVLGRKNAFSVFYERSDDRPLPVAKRLAVIGSVVPSVTYNVSF